MHPQRFCDFQNREQCRILSSALDGANKGAVNAHTISNCSLAQIGSDTETAYVDSKYFANIHPQLRNQSRILVRRIIIRDKVGKDRFCDQIYEGGWRFLKKPYPFLGSVIAQKCVMKATILDRILFFVSQYKGLSARILGMTIPVFQDEPPLTLRVNSYDERHFATYLRLLDAAAENADWREVVAIIFGLDPEKEPDRAKIVYESHLARALWMSNTGYRHLLEPRLQ